MESNNNTFGSYRLITTVPLIKARKKCVLFTGMVKGSWWNELNVMTGKIHRSDIDIYNYNYDALRCQTSIFSDDVKKIKEEKTLGKNKSKRGVSI